MPRIAGIGVALPARRVDNVELAPLLRRSAEEIERRSGVSWRSWAADGEGPSDLARRAAAAALEQAKAGPADVELIVFATMTPDVTFPGSGCYLQDKLGCGTVGALDLRGQCAGFLFALETADQFVRAGAYRGVLIAAAEVHSSGLDLSPRGAEVTPLFGDGAAAVLLVPGEGIVETVLHTDATRFERFWCEFPSSRRFPLRFTAEDLEAGRQFPRIDAEAVRRDGLEQICSAVAEVADRARVRIGEVKHAVLQHVFPDVARAAARKLGLEGRATIPGPEGGHVAAASLPIGLWRAIRSGRAEAGDLVCLATAGSGANWGATLLHL